MPIAFSEIISKISEYEIIQTVNDQVDTLYLQAQLFSDHQASFLSGTIYVGKASRVPTELCQRDDLGLILINDCNFNFSELRGNAAELSTDIDLSGLFNDILNIINSKRKIADISAAFLDYIVEGKGLNDIIEISAKLIGNPISLVDYTGKQLVTTAIQESDTEGSISLTPEGYPTQETYSIFREKNYTKIVNESSTPILLESDHPEIPRMIVGKIAIRNQIVGHLAIMENEKTITEDDIVIAKVLIDVIAAIVQKDNYYLLMTGIHHEYFILDLIQENHDNPTTIEDRVHSLKWDIYDEFYAVTISIPKKNDAFFFVEYLRTRLGHIFPFSKSIYYNEHVILVVYKEQNIQKIIKDLSTILMENDLTAGISQKFSSIINLKKYYEQAMQALNIGKLLKKEKLVFLYDNLYTYDLLTILNRHANLKDFCHPGIDKLLKHDEENGTDYYPTFFEYMMGNANLSKVANKLHIHRNTLYYRISKIFEIIELDLENGDDYFKILLSLKILELYDISSDLEL